MGSSLNFKIFTVHWELGTFQSILSHKMPFHFLHNCFTFPSPRQTITLKWEEKILLSRWRTYLLRQKNERKMFQVSLHLFAINVKNLLKIDYRADKRHQVDSQRAGNPQFTHWTSEYSDPQAKKTPILQNLLCQPIQSLIVLSEPNISFVSTSFSISPKLRVISYFSFLRMREQGPVDR